MTIPLTCCFQLAVNPLHTLIPETRRTKYASPLLLVNFGKKHLFKSMYLKWVISLSHSKTDLSLPHHFLHRIIVHWWHILSSKVYAFLIGAETQIISSIDARKETTTGCLFLIGISSSILRHTCSASLSTFLSVPRSEEVWGSASDSNCPFSECALANVSTPEIPYPFQPDFFSRFPQRNA